jgi:hypothetical protein
MGKVKFENKVNSNNLPWAISEEEFKLSGKFDRWNSEAITAAINTLMELSVIAYHLQPKDRIKQ